jgi:hypothetical protein
VDFAAARLMPGAAQRTIAEDGMGVEHGTGDMPWVPVASASQGAALQACG